MVSSVLLFNLILLLKIILQTECKSLVTTPQSSSSHVADTDTEVLIITNINDTELNTTKDEVNSPINLGEPFGLTIETRSKRESSAMNTVNSTNTNQTSSRLEETIQEMFFEPWGRIRRDTDDAQDQNSDGSDSEETAQDGSSNESAQNQNSNEGKSDYNDTDEDNDPSHESSVQLEPDGTNSMHEEVREKRYVGELGETLEEGEYRYRSHPYQYRQPIIRRYWSSYERKSSRDFIKIPIFPGK